MISPVLCSQFQTNSLSLNTSYTFLTFGDGNTCDWASAFALLISDTRINFWAHSLKFA